MESTRQRLSSLPFSSIPAVQKPAKKEKRGVSPVFNRKNISLDLKSQWSEVSVSTCSRRLSANEQPLGYVYVDFDEL